ncbi:MAG TPA: M48 family metallopeptidase [Myxococcota bacterium]
MAASGPRTLPGRKLLGRAALNFAQPRADEAAHVVATPERRLIELDAQLREADGPRITPITLQAFADGELHVEGAGRSLALSARALRIGPRAADGSRSFALEDGARVAIPRSDELERWLQRHRGGGEGLAGARLRGIARTLGSLAAAALLTFGVVRVAVPGLAWLVARALPYSLDEKLGTGVLRAMGESFGPSALDEAHRERVRACFERTASYAHLTRPATLEFRAGGEMGANAFALPGGTVVVTDELIALAQSDDELAAVLAHELGHLQHRHGVRALLQALGVGVLANGALGDFDGAGLVAAAPMLLQLQYSRGFEREADAFAQRVLEEARIDPSALSRMLARLEATHPGGELPAYLSTHPPTAERQRALREAE